MDFESIVSTNFTTLAFWPVQRNLRITISLVKMFPTVSFECRLVFRADRLHIIPVDLRAAIASVFLWIPCFKTIKDMPQK